MRDEPAPDQRGRKPREEGPAGVGQRRPHRHDRRVPGLRPPPRPGRADPHLRRGSAASYLSARGLMGRGIPFL